MKFANSLAIAAVCAAFALAPSASAAGLIDCIQMGKQVTVALTSAQPSQSTDAARVQADAARNYCVTGMYAQGIARYTKALQLLSNKA
jgi:hypothetical protein